MPLLRELDPDKAEALDGKCWRVHPALGQRDPTCVAIVYDNGRWHPAS